MEQRGNVGDLSSVIAVTVIFLVSMIAAAQSPLDARDGECHECADDHNEYYWMRLALVSYDISGSQRVDSEFEVSVTFRNDCNNDNENYNRMSYVDCTLSSENGTVTITDSQQTVNNVRVGSSNQRTVTWTVTGKEIGKDDLAVDLHGQSSHKSVNFYNASTMSIEVGPGLPDASIRTISADPETIVAGDVVNITTTVRNTGQDATWNLTILMDSTEVGTVQVDIATGEEPAVSMLWDSSGQEGDHTITVNVSGAPDEEDFGGNEKDLDVFVNSPTDLMIMGVSAPSSVQRGTLVDIGADLRNTGLNDTDFDIILVAGGSEVFRTSVTLGGGNDTTADLEFDTSVFSGDVALSVEVDPDNEVAEEDEGNNIEEFTITVLAPPETPDPAVFSYDIVPAGHTIEGAEAKVKIAFRNLGNASVNFTGRLDIGNVTLYRSLTLSPLTVRTVNYRLNDSWTLGEHTVTVSIEDIDPADEDTANNAAQSTIRVVERPDVTISDVAAWPAMPIEGGSFTATANITNSGGFRAECTVNMTYLNASSSHSVTVPANDTRSVSYEFVHGSNAPVAVTVWVEPWEWDASDNNASVDVVAAQFQALHLTNLTAPDAAIEGDAVVITATVRNLGVAGNGTLSILIDNETVLTAELAIGNGRNSLINFTWNSTRGSHLVTALLELPTEDSGPLSWTLSRTIVVSRLLSPSEFSIAAVTLSPSDPSSGEAVSISVTVSNTGELDSNVTVGFYLNGMYRSSRNVRIDGGGVVFVGFGWTATDGEHELTFKIFPEDVNATIMDGSAGRSVNVRAPRSSSDGSDEAVFDAMVPVSLIAVALGLVVLIFWRRGGK